MVIRASSQGEVAVVPVVRAVRTLGGGNGAGGLVIVSVPYAEGTCLSTNGTYNQIRDNGCASNGATTGSGFLRAAYPPPWVLPPVMPVC